MSIEVMRKLADAYKQVNEKKKKLDPVDKDELKGSHADRDDKDIDNDGDADSSDEFLHKKRKAISKNMKKKGKDEEVSMNPKMNKDKESKASDNDTMEAAVPVSDNEIDEEITRGSGKKGLDKSLDKLYGPKKSSGNPGMNRFRAGETPYQKRIKKITGKDKLDSPHMQPQKEGKINAPVYARILEKRHGSEGAPKEKWDEKEKNNKGAMDMRKDMKAGNPDKVDNPESEKIKDPSKKAPLRPGDNAKGDKNIIPSATPAKGN